MLVLEKFLKGGATDGVEIVLPPLRSPVRMIEGGGANFVVVVGEVDDEFVGAGRQRREHFFVGRQPLVFADIPGHLEDLIDGHGIHVESRGQGRIHRVAWLPGEQQRNVVVPADGEINVEERLRAEERSHVAVEMRGLDAGGLGFVHLRAELGFHVRHLRVLVHIFGKERQVAIPIDKAGMRLSRYRTPPVRCPICIEGEMDAEVGVGMALCPSRDLREPGTRHHDAGRGDPVMLEGIFDGVVNGVHHPEIVGMDDQQARIRRIAQAFGDGLAIRVRRGLRGAQEGGEKQGDSDGEATSITFEHRCPRKRFPVYMKS